VGFFPGDKAADA